MKKKTKIILIVIAAIVVLFLLIPTGDSEKDTSTQPSIEKEKETTVESINEPVATVETNLEVQETKEATVDYSFMEGEDNIFECYTADTEEDIYMDLNWENIECQKVQYVVYNGGEEFEKGCAVQSPADENVYIAADGTKLTYEGKDCFTLESDTINDIFTLTLDEDNDYSGTESHIVYLTSDQEVLNFFGDSSNVGKTFSCTFTVLGYDDYPTLNTSWYVLSFATLKGQSFMVDMFGYEGNRLFDNSSVSVTGIFSSDNSVNADFDITAISVEVLD